MSLNRMFLISFFSLNKKNLLHRFAPKNYDEQNELENSRSQMLPIESHAHDTHEPFHSFF